MYKFTIQIILDIGYGKYRKNFNITFLAKKLGKSIVLCLGEFSCSPVKTLRVLLKRKGKIGSSKKIELAIPFRSFQVQNKILKLVDKFLNIQHIVLQKNWK